jgi:hypothetical protein
MNNQEIDDTIEAIVNSGLQYDALRMLLEHASDETLHEIRMMFPIEQNIGC